MLKTLALEAFGFQPFSKRRKPNIKVIKANKTSWKFWLTTTFVVANAILLMSYVYGVNKYSSVGYEIKSLEKKISTLSEENKKINLKVSEAGSMVSIQNDFLSSSFVPAGSARYLQVDDDQFTLR